MLILGFWTDNCTYLVFLLNLSSKFPFHVLGIKWSLNQQIFHHSKEAELVCSYFTLYKLCAVWKRVCSTRWFQVMGIPRKGGQCLTVIYSNIVAWNTNFSSDMWEGIPVKRLTPKSYLKSFSDASESHKTSTNLSVRAYFRQFSDWQETYFGHSQESPGTVKGVQNKSHHQYWKGYAVQDYQNCSRGGGDVDGCNYLGEWYSQAIPL